MPRPRTPRSRGQLLLALLAVLHTLPHAQTAAAGTSLADSAWREFRGPAGQGHASTPSLPTRWDNHRNVRWVIPVPGTGWSSPVIANNKVFLTSAISNAEANGGMVLQALCFDVHTGKTLWTTDLFRPSPASKHDKNTHASPTPTLGDDRVYAHFGPYGTACLDFEGHVLWKTEALAYNPVHGGGCSPVLSGNRLVFSCDGAENPFIAALDASSGQLAWKSPRITTARKTFSFCTPTLLQSGDHVELISPGSGVVNALDPQTGSEYWRVRYGEGYSVVPRPVYGDGLIFIGTGFDRPSVLAIRAGGQGDVTETHVAWSLTRGAPNTPSLLFLNSLLYMVSDAGIASCVDARTGQIHWQERLGGNFSSSPLHAAGNLYFQSEEGTATVLRAGTNYSPIATNKLGERTLASYAAADSALFIRTAAHLYRIQNLTP